MVFETLKLVNLLGHSPELVYIRLTGPVCAGWGLSGLLCLCRA